MLAKSMDSELFADWSESIKDDQVRSAFWYLIGIAACLRSHDCEIRWKGDVRDFRFFDKRDEQPFSFITNQKWLKFYFRGPAVHSNRFEKRDVSKLFSSFDENTAGEWTIELRSIDDVRRLAEYIWV